MKIDLLQDDNATTLINDPDFIRSWETICKKCKYSTYFQQPFFVRTWFSCYSNVWTPVIVLSRRETGDLAALWILAYSAATKTLTHPGSHQAEYQTWISLPGCDIPFVSAAWVEITQQLTFSSLKIKYHPSTALTEALHSSPDISGISLVRYHKRPILTLNLDEIEASFKKKSNKSRFNRLKRLGELNFREIKTSEDLDAVLDQLIDFYDFRQGATNASTPFRSDPQKKRFLSNLLADPEGGAHVTVTSLNGHPISAFWGGVSSSTVHLGMLIHSPFYAEHSPGKLHIMQLSKHLLESGIEKIDITPGGDPWKERFANSHDHVAEIELFRTGRSRLIAKQRSNIERLAKRCLTLFGVTPSAVRARLSRIKNVTPRAIAKRLRNWVSMKRELRIYRCERDLSLQASYHSEIQLNSLQDLMSFEPGERWQTYHGFLRSALHRLENGESAFTISINGKLAASGWMVKNQSKAILSEVDQTMDMPESSASLYDFYTDPEFRGQGLYRKLISHMLKFVFDDEKTKYAYICVLADNTPSRHVIENTGFKHQGSFYFERKFEKKRRWSDHRMQAAENHNA